MGTKPTITCPYCSSFRVIRNGHPHSKKLEFFCKNCHKYFYENTAKGYPPTSIPFPIIAYFLYFHKKIPEFSNMREFRRFVNHWLIFLGIEKGDISRQIIHHWIKNYEPGLDKIISFEEARDFCHNILSEKLKPIPQDIIQARSVSHKAALRVLKDKLGQQQCFDLIRREKELFKELCEITSKYEVYCWKHLNKEELGRSKRLFLARS